jgi:ribonuclease E
VGTPEDREGIERMLDETEKGRAEQADESRAAQAGDKEPTARPKRPRRSAQRPAGPSLAFTAPGANDGESAPVSPPQTAAKGAARGRGKPPPPSTAAPLFQPPPSTPALPRKKRQEEPTESRDEREQARDQRDQKESGGQSGRNRKRTGGQGDSKPKKSDTKGESEAPTRSGKKGTTRPDESSTGKKDPDTTVEDDDSGDGSEAGDSGTGKRRRRRRRREEDGYQGRKKSGSGEVTAVKGSTRIEAKRQRRREGRESGRRRAPVLTESEFLARRESVERSMVVRQRDSLTQIAVLEDQMLVEHYVNRATATSQVGNVYLGRVQNVLPSMEAAFVDIGRGRNAVLYAGEVNWDAAGLEGQAKRIEKALSSGDKILVQVTKDPVGHKGARLTTQVSLPGRFVVLVPDGSMTGISRKLPDKERSRLRGILKRVVPQGYGVIVRTAAEGASEDDLTRDVEMLNKEWDRIQKRSGTAKVLSQLHTEPDLALRVLRDIFNTDFKSLVVSGDEIWQTLKQYVDDNAPALSERVAHWTSQEDIFATNRIDEQLSKALDRKVWLPSGGSLVIDRTEAMTVVDVNTGRFTGQGGNLEETVTENNLEAAEEIVRQLRLRDVGGIIVIDFIDMVLESNRDLVVRRLIECLSRDRTKHQVAEVTSLGLVQMTRKRVGQGLMETFSEPCECCNGRGEKVHDQPVSQRSQERRVRPSRPPGAHDPAEVAARAANEAGETDASGGETSLSDDDEVSVDDIVESTAEADQTNSGDAEVSTGSASRSDAEVSLSESQDSDAGYDGSDSSPGSTDQSEESQRAGDSDQEQAEFDQSEETP